MNEHHERIMRYFAYEHLPPHLAEVSAMFHDAALRLTRIDAVDPVEMTVALRKLLEAKDAAVRACVPERN